MYDDDLCATITGVKTLYVKEIMSCCRIELIVSGNFDGRNEGLGCGTVTKICFLKL